MTIEGPAEGEIAACAVGARWAGWRRRPARVRQELERRREPSAKDGLRQAEPGEEVGNGAETAFCGHVRDVLCVNRAVWQSAIHAKEERRHDGLNKRSVAVWEDQPDMKTVSENETAVPSP